MCPIKGIIANFFKNVSDSADDSTDLGDTKNKTIQIHLGVSAKNPMVIGERKGA